jgi:hypothetical protein
MKLTFFLLVLLLSSKASYSQEKITIDSPDSKIKGLKLGAALSLSAKDAIDRIKLYKGKRYKRHKRMGLLGNKYDAGSCFFDMKKLDGFRKAINENLRVINGKDSVSGFRFYYMVYKKGDKHAPDELVNTVKKTKKIHSLLIVATHCVPSGKENECVETDIIDEDSNIASLQAIVQNEGVLCPPLPPKNCGGAIIANSIYR